MPDLNPATSLISAALPVTPAAPLPGNGAQGANAAQSNDGQSAFAQVLRDKQQANLDAAKPASSDKPSKPEDGKNIEKSTPSDAKTTNEESDEVAARTPAELAQLLAAAGLIAQTTSTQAATDTDTDSTVANSPTTPADVATDLTANASKLATDPALLGLAAQSNITAATNGNPAASLAANTTNSATSNAAELALAAQSQLAGLDDKGNQSGASGQNPQSSDKQALLSVANDTDSSKSRTDGASNQPNFAAALETASQTKEGALSPITSTSSNATQNTQSPAATHTVSTPVGRQGWADEVGQRVLWTAKSDNSRAELVLTPAHLGRIEVSIQVNGDHATASFVAANAIAREAMQDAMPRLRELMAQSGIQLGQSDVSAGQTGQNNAQGERRTTGSAGQGMVGVDGLLSATTPSTWIKQGLGSVDTFA